jgi:anti-anti-sigma factor
MRITKMTSRLETVEPDLVFEATPLRIARTDDPPGLRVHGEIDFSNFGDFRDSLIPLVSESTTDVHVDFVALSFIDLAGLRVLVTAAGSLPPDVRLVVHGAKPFVGRVLHLVGWGSVPSLLFD